MQINPNFAPNILAAMHQSQTALNTALQQVATGLGVTVPSDNPAASAAMVQNTIDTRNLDQYTKNISTVQATVETASSILSNVVTALTQAISLGTEGANGTSSSANRMSIATQVQGILSTVVSQANTSVAGSYLFGGTKTELPYTPNLTPSTGYTYNGNTEQTSVVVGDTLSVQVNLPGSTIFDSVLGSLGSLVTALGSGTSSDITAATNSLSSAITSVGTQQAFYSNAVSQLSSQGTYLQQDTVTLASQAKSLVGIDLATAATNLAQAETENSAVLAAAAKVLPTTLLSYLSAPS